MNMGLNPTQEQILYMGYPRGYLNIIKTEGLQYVQRCNPDIVVLQIGSNDLCKETNEVHDVAKGIIEVAMSLRFKYNVKKVIVCQILHRIPLTFVRFLHRIPPRKRIRYEVDIPWFNGRCDELNTYLIRYFKDDKMENVVFLETFWFLINRK